MMEPVLAELATFYSGRMEVVRLDVDRDQDVSMRYSVMSMPTLMLFAGGQPVDRMVGFSNANRVRGWVADTLRAATG
jgi:thioredoxin 1